MHETCKNVQYIRDRGLRVSDKLESFDRCRNKWVKLSVENLLYTISIQVANTGN